MSPQADSEPPCARIGFGAAGRGAREGGEEGMEEVEEAGDNRKKTRIAR
jgi:hypothetical protein